MTRLGIFGGTFDPVHLGHLILAEQCREQGRLDQVLFVPAARPPHKLERPTTPFDKRVEMLALAVSGQPAFRVDELEKDRDGPSFTVDTLQTLKHRHPDAELALLVGSDTLRDFPTWYQPLRILELAEILVMIRPGSPMIVAEELSRSVGASVGFVPKVTLCDVPLIDIASRDLRRRVAEGRSIRYMVPRAVEAYIRDKGLYVT